MLPSYATIQVSQMQQVHEFLQNITPAESWILSPLGLFDPLKVQVCPTAQSLLQCTQQPAYDPRASHAYSVRQLLNAFQHLRNKHEDVIDFFHYDPSHGYLFQLGDFAEHVHLLAYLDFALKTPIGKQEMMLAFRSLVPDQEHNVIRNFSGMFAQLCRYPSGQRKLHRIWKRYFSNVPRPDFLQTKPTAPHKVIAQVIPALLKDARKFLPAISGHQGFRK